MAYKRYGRLYKHDRRGYFHKHRWPIGGDLLTEKISRMHNAFDPRRGRMVSAGWDGRTGTGLMHVFDRHADRIIQVRVIVRGYIYRMFRNKQAEDFDRLWHDHPDRFPDVVELVREFENLVFVEFEKRGGVLYGRFSDRDGWFLFPDEFAGVGLKAFGNRVVVTHR